MTDIGTLGGSLSEGRSINTAGQVTGWSYTSNGSTHAFVYSNGAMADLNDLIDPMAGWSLVYGHGINNLGQIVGAGTFNGHDRAFLLTPISDGAVPEPATWMMLLGGFFLTGGALRRRGRRGDRAAA